MRQSDLGAAKTALVAAGRQGAAGSGRALLPVQGRRRAAFIHWRNHHRRQRRERELRPHLLRRAVALFKALTAGHKDFVAIGCCGAPARRRRCPAAPAANCLPNTLLTLASGLLTARPCAASGNSPWPTCCPAPSNCESPGARLSPAAAALSARHRFEIPRQHPLCGRCGWGQPRSGPRWQDAALRELPLREIEVEVRASNP